MQKRVRSDSFFALYAKASVNRDDVQCDLLLRV